MKVPSMISGGGWFAVFNDGGVPLPQPLIGWIARVDGDGECQIVGVSTSDATPWVTVPEDSEHFAFYFHESQGGNIESRFAAFLAKHQR